MLKRLGQVLFILFILSLTSLSATTLTVPTQYGTIQAALDNALSNDTVLVEPGTYTGNGNRDLNCSGKNIVLKGINGATQTIIDCQGNQFDQHDGLNVQSGEEIILVIDGFTFRNAYKDYRGAINMLDYNSEMTVKNCIIENNFQYGIIKSYGLKTSRIENCQILNNASTGISVGGSFEIENCMVVGNENGITIDSWIGLIKNNTCVDNAEYGILIYGEPPKKTAGNTAGAYDSLHIQNNIVAYNGSASIGQYFWQQNISAVCNIVYPQELQLYFSPNLENNYNVQPLFCDYPSGNYFLTSSSKGLPANNNCGVQIGAVGIGCGSCCQGIRGNGNYDFEDQLDVTDLLFLVDYFFADPQGAAPACFEEADVNGDSILDVSDLLYLIDFMFAEPSGPAPVACD